MRRCGSCFLFLVLTFWVASPVARGVEPQTLSLDEALALFDRANPDLAALRARVDAAEGVARQAMSAMLPGLFASGSYVRNRDEAQFAGPMGPIVIQPRGAFSAAGTLRVPLFAQNAYWDFAQARELTEEAGASFQAQRLRLRGAFVRACWMEQAAESVVAVAERGLAFAREHGEGAERAEKAGTTTNLSVLQARSEVTRRQKELTEASSALGHARLALGALLGRDAPLRITMPEVADVVAPAAEEELVSSALVTRSETRARAAEVRAADRGVTSAWMRLTPGLSGSFSWFVSDEPYVTGQKDGWRATVDLTWALYDGGFRGGKRREAEAQAAAARAQADATHVAIAKEVHEAALDVGVARERLKVATEQAALAEETARTARRGFAAGVATSLDVIDALDRQTQAAVALEQSRAGLGIALAALHTARGLAW